jgi:hypothetical protein
MILLATDLLSEEYSKIAEEFDDLNIKYKIEGRMNRIYYDIYLLDEKDISVAVKIVTKYKVLFKEVREDDLKKCPRCNKKIIIELEKKFFDKIYSFGTKKMECLSCGKRWYQ